MSVSAQLTKADLKTMTPEEIVQAQREGRLDVLIGRKPAPAPLSVDVIASLPREDIDRLIAERGGATPTAIGSIDQGARTGDRLGDITDPGQLSRMSPDAIVAAHRAGRLDRLLGIKR